MRRSLLVLGFGMEWKSFRFLGMLAPRWLVVIVLIEADLARRRPAHIGSDSPCFASRFPIFCQQCAGGRVMGRPGRSRARASPEYVPAVIPAKAGTYRRPIRVYDQEIHHVDGWVPAFAGMTQL